MLFKLFWAEKKKSSVPPSGSEFYGLPIFDLIGYGEIFFKYKYSK